MPTNSSTPQKKHALPADFGSYAALYVTIAAFSLVTLISQSAMWTTGRWLPYVIGVVLFTLIADRCARHPDPSTGYVLACVMGLTIILIPMIVLSDYFFLTVMLSFIIVAVAQGNLPRRLGYIVDVLLLAVLATTYAVGVSPSAALQGALGLSAGFVFIIVFTQLAHSERHAREQLERANQQLAEYAAQVEQLATMRERNRLANEVHDTIGHYLTVINVQLEVVNKLIETNPVRAKEAALKAKELASEGLNEVRRSVAALRPTPLDDRPLPDAIRALTNTSREAGLLTSFEQSGAARSLSPEIEIVLYRAAQEALTNIRKHAHASAASVQLIYDTDAVSLEVQDNGIGRKGNADSVGLSALRERATALNGTVIAENRPEGGFLMEVTLPVGPAASYGIDQSPHRR